MSKPFRDEIEALGGYDTRETGKIVESGDNHRARHKNMAENRI
jgi:hypothetical protein